MTKERYNRQKDSWNASNGRRTVFDKAEDIYEQVGARFHIRWVEGDPIVDFDELPDGVTKSEVKKAIRDNV